MPMQDIAELGIVIAALIAIGAALYVDRWSSVLIVCAAAYLGQAFVISAIEPTALLIGRNPAGALGQFLAVAVFGSAVYGLRRAIGAVWRRMRPSERRPEARA
jgi:hypothetical protein